MKPLRRRVLPSGIHEPLFLAASAQPTEPIERWLLHEGKEGFDEADQRFRGIQQEASEAADQSAVEADKLKVASDVALDQIDQLSCVQALT